MGRLLDAAVTADPTAGVHRLPQPFRMIDKILSGVVDDAADKAVARERRRLARLGIVEGTKMYRPAARTVELEHAATCVCVARFEDDDAESADWSAVGDASDARRTAPSSSDPLASSGDADPNASSHDVARRETERDATSTSRSVAAVVFAGDEDGCVLAVDAATGALRDDAGAAHDDRTGEYHEADIRLALDLEARRLEEEARCGACCTIS